MNGTRASPDGLCALVLPNRVRVIGCVLVFQLTTCYKAKNSGFGPSSEDNAKFDSPWRRDGPLPDLPNSRDGPRRRFDGPPGDRSERPVAVSDGVDQWRSSRPLRTTAESEAPSFKRKGSGFNTPDAGAADKDENWSIGSKFKAAGPEEGMGKPRPRGDMGPPKELPSDEGDWRSARPAKPLGGPRASISRMCFFYYQRFSTDLSLQPTALLPLLPYSLVRNWSSYQGRVALRFPPALFRRPRWHLQHPQYLFPSPILLVRPSMCQRWILSAYTCTDNARRPVDVSNRDKEVAERLERDKGAVQEKLSMSRSNSRPGMERPAGAATPAAAPPPKNPVAKAPGPSLVPTVRPTLSFANVAAKKESALKKGTDAEEVAEEAEKVAEDLDKVEL